MSDHAHNFDELLENEKMENLVDVEVPFDWEAALFDTVVPDLEYTGYFRKLQLKLYYHFKKMERNHQKDMEAILHQAEDNKILKEEIIRLRKELDKKE
jgi:hypothetical protein